MRPAARPLLLASLALAVLASSRTDALALAMVIDPPVVTDSAAILAQQRQNLDLTKKTNSCLQTIQAATGKTGKDAGCSGMPKTPTSCPGGTSSTQAQPVQSSNPATTSPASSQAASGSSSSSTPSALSIALNGAQFGPGSDVSKTLAGAFGATPQSQTQSQTGSGSGASSMPSMPGGSCKGTSAMVKSGGMTSGAGGMTPALQSNSALSTPSSSGPSSLSAQLGKLNAVINGQVTGSQAITQLQSILYINSAAAPTSQQVEAVNDIRRLNIQNASIEALAAALQAKNAAANLSGGTLKAMMTDAQNTQDVRGDLAANVTAMLKMLEQAVVQNGLLAADLHLECAILIGNDGENGRDGGNQNKSGSTSTASSAGSGQ